ncbi:DUF397 domain-containing protein [Actinomadura sp. 1N219]|uniref:DUF397 domain-containing protein n=1 Tax=Actinomadura sp. 1N219 TaxID=3375152 RepID=UPI00379CFB1F
MYLSKSEFRLVFRKSSYSGSTNAACVELAAAGRLLLVRDSKNPDGGMIRLDLPSARRLIARLRG